MKINKVLIIDNFDSFTFNLVDYFRLLEREVMIYRNNIEPEKIRELNPDLIVFSPGPSVPKNAGNMMRIIDLYHKEIPMFGVCLGQEALIKYFGGELKLVKPVHGKASPIKHDGKTIFHGLQKNFLGGRYHSLIGSRIPECFEISATTDNEGSKLVMAIRHKTLPIEAVQFHPESVLTMKNKNGFKLISNILNNHFANVE